MSGCGCYITGLGSGAMPPKSEKEAGKRQRPSGVGHGDGGEQELVRLAGLRDLGEGRGG